MQKYSNFAIELAVLLFKTDGQNALKSRFNDVYNALQGVGGDMFNPTETLSLEQAIKKHFNNIDYVPNGQIKRTNVEQNSSESEARRTGDGGTAASGKQSTQGVQPADSGRGISGNNEGISRATPTNTEEAIEAQQPNINPTEAQKEAGNYKKAHIKINGMDISVENPIGSVRRGVDEDGTAWEHEMKSHYGYFKGTIGKDGDHIDVFTKSNTPDDYSGPVFVIDQVNPSTGKFDESKVMLGYDNAEEAKQAYLELRQRLERIFCYYRGWD